MALQIQSVYSPAFRMYGKIINDYDFSGIVNALRESTPCPEDGTIYLPSVQALEQLPIFEQLQKNFYGGLPIQVGCCNGYNTRLNCLEYHRNSEINIAADDIILLLAWQQNIANNTLDTAKVEAFLVPAGTGVELYATTLHYAPCVAKQKGLFRVAVVLPQGTNLDKPDIQPNTVEDKMLWAANKWLLAHPDSSEAANGAFVGLQGTNIDLAQQLSEAEF